MGFHPSSNRPDSSPQQSANTPDWLQGMNNAPSSPPPFMVVPTKPKQRSGCTTFLIVTLLTVIILGCGAIFLIGYQEDQQQKATQTAMFTAFGSDTMALCSKQRSTTRRAGALGAGKVLVLWDNSTNPHKDIYNALPAEIRATEKNGTVAIACIKQENKLVHTVKYEKNNVSRGTCKEWQVSVQVSLLDAKSGQVVDSTAFLGAEPPECPETISVKQGQNADEHRYGAAPDVSLAANWIKKRLAG